MLTKRIIPCLDIRNRKVTKGVRFQDNIDVGDPVEMASAYSEGGCDELVFYDITASAERRPIDIEMVKAVAHAVHIPFAVGGGISSLQDMERVLLAGAEKISLNSLAVQNPSIIKEGARAFGSQCIVLGMDPVRVEEKECEAPNGNPPLADQVFAEPSEAITAQRLRAKGGKSGYEITIRGFRERTGLDALEWAKKAVDLGAGEIVVNSVDADGTLAGYEINLTRMIAVNVPVPVVASGGAGKPEHLVSVFREGRADAAIVASIIHSGQFTIRQIKEVLAGENIPVRKKW